MASVTFVDESLPGTRTTIGTSDFPATTVTARDIIARRVAQDVAAINADRRVGAARSLITPTDPERQLNGERRGTPPPTALLDEEAMRTAALDAFTRNGFFLIVGETQLTRLDEQVTISLETEVVFIRLLPLVGG